MNIHVFFTSKVPCITGPLLHEFRVISFSKFLSCCFLAMMEISGWPFSRVVLHEVVGDCFSLPFTITKMGNLLEPLSSCLPWKWPPSCEQKIPQSTCQIFLQELGGFLVYYSWAYHTQTERYIYHNFSRDSCVICICLCTIRHCQNHVTFQFCNLRTCCHGYKWYGKATSSC